MPDYITIPLSKNGNKYKDKYETYVSIEDADLAEVSWRVRLSFGRVYAFKQTSRTLGTRKYIHLHRVILSRKLGRELLPHEQVDHINMNGLDNRRENLRLATHSQNNHNRTQYRNNKSGYKGVNKRGHRWYAAIKVNGKQIHLGTFDTPEQAYEAYKQAAIKYHGEFANFGNINNP